LISNCQNLCHYTFPKTGITGYLTIQTKRALY